jgi:chemotaxis methyl-accepting protein methylase
MSPARAHLPSPLELSPLQLGELLAIIAERTGVDLAGQRPAMLARRAAFRIGASGARTAGDYLELLRADAAESWLLLERLTIKVSQLFRNPETFSVLRDRVLPELRRRAPHRELRVWSAGCACGEEAYGLAMVCAATGGRWSVLGTDVDRSALARARAGAYPLLQLGHVPPELARRHLGAHGDAAVAVREELARHVHFAAHDLASGALPVRSGRFDLIACRNVLIYYLADRQAEILSLLLSALVPGGVLVLGEAEWPVPSVERRLAILDRAHRIFTLPARAAERSD